MAPKANLLRYFETTGVRLTELKLITRCKEMKVLEVMVIYFGLESFSSLSILNILVESDCLEVVHLLNDEVVDILWELLLLSK